MGSHYWEICNLLEAVSWEPENPMDYNSVNHALDGMYGLKKDML